MRNAINVLSFISGVEHAIGVDGFMIRIAQDWKTQLALSVGSDFFSEVLAYVRRIDADRVELYIFILC